MRTKLPWLILLLGAGLLASCTMVPPGDFNVSVQTKTMAHPYFGIGDSLGYVVDGIQGEELTLTRGMTYTFAVTAPGHPFYISTDSAGGSGAPGEVTVGVTGSRVDVGTLTFTPDGSHVTPLYYQCTVHSNMGYRINIID